jgi:hypothetical protein
MSDKLKLFVISLGLALAAAFFAHHAGAAQKTDLGSAIVYPNPFDASAGHTVITFDNLTERVRVRIYTVSGRQVANKTLITINGAASWDTRDDDGGLVPAGLYVYLITDDHGHKTKGKLALVR